MQELEAPLEPSTVAVDLLNGRADAGAWATIEISDSAQ
jgi:hypothetical protein